MTITPAESAMQFARLKVMIFMVDVSGIEHRVLEKDFGKMK